MGGRRTKQRLSTTLGVPDFQFPRPTLSQDAETADKDMDDALGQFLTGACVNSDSKYVNVHSTKVPKYLIRRFTLHACA